jgi:hypothetical protein
MDLITVWLCHLIGVGDPLAVKVASAIRPLVELGLKVKSKS